MMNSLRLDSKFRYNFIIIGYFNALRLWETHLMCMNIAISCPIQGRLKILTEHSTLILLIFIPFEVAQQKFQHFYNLGRNEFSPNLKGVAQKMDLPCPFEVLDIFGGKSKSNAPKVFKFGTKWVPIEVNNWWKFGVDISNHFWEI